MTRGPMIVHCPDCKHEWSPVLLPMNLERAASILKRLGATPCFWCGSTKAARVGPVPRLTNDGDALGWLDHGDVGMSSETIWRVLMGESPRHPRTPWDPADFGRCYRLLKVMPSWRERLGEVAAQYPEWQPLVNYWHELTALYEEELPNGTCPKLYARMRELRGDR